MIEYVSVPTFESVAPYINTIAYPRIAVLAKLIKELVVLPRVNATV